MGTSESRLKANKKYMNKAYSEIKFRARREIRLNDLIELAAQQTKKSKAQYMLDAILAQLDNDGISIDMLPSDDQGITEE